MGIINKKKTVLVTGGTGFVGTHTIRDLLDAGYNVRCLIRKSSDTSRLPEEVSLAEGHLLNYDSLVQAVKGCWGVMHLAGVVRTPNPRDFFLVNRDGTGNIARAAREGKVERFVYCSSMAAGGPSTKTMKMTAEQVAHPVTEYGKSKYAGEIALTEQAGKMWHCIVRPPPVYGPYDAAFLTVVKWVQHGFKLRLGAKEVPNSIIHAEDLARALTLALEAKADSGQVWYACDGEVHSMERIYSAVEAALGLKARWITIPLALAGQIANVMEFAAGFAGKAALLGKPKVTELRQEAWTCDDSALRKATGYQNKYDLETGFKQTVEWYREHGWI